MVEIESRISIPDEIIASKIYFIRGNKVMLDRDLAELYGIETKVLKQTVRRNINRFPSDFMFAMSTEELHDWRSQFVTSNTDKMGLRYPPFCFAEHGVLMLSCVLNSDRAIKVNILIFDYIKELEKEKLQKSEQQNRKKIGYKR